jgi:Arc/MetJ-type ribon-helix-helix transcriptional regulator
METSVKFEGVPEYILDRLVTMGYFRTKTEALRAGVLELGKEYGILDNPKAIEDELAARKAQEVSELVKTGKAKTVPFEDVLKKAGIKEKDLSG